MTVGTGPVWWTQAAVSINLIHTGGTEGARRRLTLINICHGGGEKKVRKRAFFGGKTIARRQGDIELGSEHTNLIPMLNSLRSCVISTVHTHIDGS